MINFFFPDLNLQIYGRRWDSTKVENCLINDIGDRY